MSPLDRAKALALANAGVRSVDHLALLAGVPKTTAWRYWNQWESKKRKDLVVLAAMAKTLGMDVYELADLLAGGSAGIGYFTSTHPEQSVPSCASRRNGPHASRRVRLKTAAA